MKKREAEWTSKYQTLIPDGTWEVKLCSPNRNSISYRQFSPHQINNLLKAKHHKIIVKIRDVGRHKKEFDGFSQTAGPSWVILVYKNGKSAYAVDIDTFYTFCIREGNKLVTERHADLLGDKIL
jgi:penicillin-binding protein-related factor A (putative recombinase)